MEIVLATTTDDAWEALTDAERLETWFANDVELDARPGGPAVFRWDNGEERHGTVEAVDEPERIVLRFDDDGIVELELADDEGGTRVRVRETSPEWSIALGLRALATCATV